MKPGDGIFPWAQIRYVARTGTGHTPSRGRPELWVESECTVPWFTLADIWQLRDGARTTVTETAEHISERGLANSAAVRHPAGTVLLSRTASVGFSGVMGVDMAVSQDFMTWTPGPRLNASFLLLVLRSQREEYKRLMYGSTHKTIYMPDLLALRTPLPPLETQRRVAAFLEREHERIVTLSGRARALATRSWEPVLSYFAEQIEPYPLARVSYRYDIQLGKMLDAKRIDPDDVRPYLRNTNVQWDRLDLDDLKMMTFDATDRRKFALRPGDLLVCEGGIVGRSAVWNGEVEDCYYQKALHRVRPRGADSVRYLMWCLRLMSERGDFAADGTGSTILHLPAERLRATRIPLPSIEDQYAIVGRIDARAKRANAIQTSIDRLDQHLAEYRDALISEAVTGQLDVRGASEAWLDERAHAALEGATA